MSQEGGRLGLGWLGEPSAREFARIAHEAEAAGFTSVWLAETRFTREAIVAATAVSMATSRIRVGTAAVNVFTRGATLTAITFTALDELAGGRIVLGLGPGSPLVLASQGYGFDRPVLRLREFVAGVRAVWRGEPYSGRFVQVDGVRMEFAGPRPEVPIYLAVTGPRALELAGEVADGVILNAFTSTDYTSRAIERLKVGAARARRSLEGFPILGMVVVAMDVGDGRAREALRPLVANYLTGFPNIARESGLPQADLERYRQVREHDGLEPAASQIPDHVVDALTANGSVEDCRRRIGDYRRAGITEPIVLSTADQLNLAVQRLIGS
jgi:5,10-methylenetetrahydromethanopterin reductase